MLHKWIVVEVGLDAPRHDHHHRHDQHLDEFWKQKKTNNGVVWEEVVVY